MADAVAVEAEESSVTADAVEPPAFVELFAGAELSATEAEAVTLRWPTHFVVLAGAEGSGKTTAFASIYERLSLGALAGFQFAGSRSLLGFEQICHPNRVASGGSRPDTARTIPSEEATYFHLALKGAEAEARRQHVLLSAISGEVFRMAKNSREDCRRLTFLPRADVIVVLVDGARLAVPASRENAIADASGILSAFLDAEMLGPRARVEFVFSKLDCIVAGGKSGDDLLAKVQTRLDTKFRSLLPQLDFRRIAARPTAAAPADFLDGLGEAFASWVSPRKLHGVNENVQTPPPRDAREFSKIGWRYIVTRSSP